MLLDSIAVDFIGLETKYQSAEGITSKRRYLDSGASTLMMRTAYQVSSAFLEHYANTHSESHYSARISTQSLEWVSERALQFLGADPDVYTCILLGSGTTGCMNRIARLLASRDPRRDHVLVSLMEHHSNDLPHRMHARQVDHIALDENSGEFGAVSLGHLEQLLTRHGDRVNYIAVTAVSNVTGIVNPIHEIAAMAHRSGALVVVDAAQAAAHMPINMGGSGLGDEIDCLAFSGHKAYAPGSPGVLVVKKALLANTSPCELGGGMVDDVYVDGYSLLDKLPDREQAGTPNIPGAIALGCVLEVLDAVGMHNVRKKELALTSNALRQLSLVDGIHIYGDTDAERCPRVGTISFNLDGIGHSVLAMVLNDHFNIAVRDGCFCAHPYVKQLLASELLGINVAGRSNEEVENYLQRYRGMVRASFGLYTNADDIAALYEALCEITADPDRFCARYADMNESTRLGRLNHSAQHHFNPAQMVRERLATLGAKNIQGSKSPYPLPQEICHDVV